MYPDDIDPESGCRLPLPKRDELDDTGKRLYDIVTDPKGGTIRGLRGPGGIQLHSPAFAELARPINHYLRHEAGLGARVRELAILTTARECDSQFEWAAHEGEALRAGIAPAIIDVIKHRKSTQGLSEIDAAIIEFGRQAVGQHKVTSAAFARLKALFEPAKLVDLVMLMGNYAGTAVLLAAFDMQVADGRPLLPVP